MSASNTQPIVEPTASPPSEEAPQQPTIEPSDSTAPSDESNRVSHDDSDIIVVNHEAEMEGKTEKHEAPTKQSEPKKIKHSKADIKRSAEQPGSGPEATGTPQAPKRVCLDPTSGFSIPMTLVPVNSEDVRGQLMEFQKAITDLLKSEITDLRVEIRSSKEENKRISKKYEELSKKYHEMVLNSEKLVRDVWASLGKVREIAKEYQGVVDRAERTVLINNSTLHEFQKQHGEIKNLLGCIEIPNYTATFKQIIQEKPQTSEASLATHNSRRERSPSASPTLPPPSPIRYNHGTPSYHSSRYSVNSTSELEPIPRFDMSGELARIPRPNHQSGSEKVDSETAPPTSSTTAPTAAKDKSKRHCIFCKRSNHGSTGCLAVTSAAARKKVVMQQNLCPRCLTPNNKPGNLHSPCPSAERMCSICKDNFYGAEDKNGAIHHPALCPMIQSKASGQGGSRHPRGKRGRGPSPARRRH